MNCLFHMKLSLSMNVCDHLCRHTHRSLIVYMLSNKMTELSFCFSSETTVVATGEQETENKTGQCQKSTNFLVTYSTNISFNLIFARLQQPLPFYYFVCVGGGDYYGHRYYSFRVFNATQTMHNNYGPGNILSLLISVCQLVGLSEDIREEMTAFNIGQGEEGILAIWHLKRQRHETA